MTSKLTAKRSLAWITVAILGAVCWLIFPLARTTTGGPRGGAFHGSVLEAESGAPISGAVVAVVWDKIPRIYMDKIGYFYAAAETITDDQGRFSIPNSPKITWDLWTVVDTAYPLFCVIAPPRAVASIFNPFTKDAAGSWSDLVAQWLRGTTIALPKLESSAEYLKWGAGGCFSSDVPRNALPRYYEQNEALRNAMAPPRHHGPLVALEVEGDGLHLLGPGVQRARPAASPDAAGAP